ncbi:hypothetical protein V3851_08710 [Paenibacillus sp. M1]|uniref:Butirosin biosynthesis protein H N-terminal domain-containing protein n=1 Tax=Paenibacillus haidiansis TaxID=1574488 RepID=A0ABU7VRA5_9BACL
MLNIQPKHEDYRSCLEDILASVSAYWKRDHELMFIGSWNFCFRSSCTNTSETLGSRLHEGEENTRRYLDYYHGIVLETHDPISEKELWEIVASELTGNKPVIIYVNDYWCPWSKNYRIREEMHPCLAVGMGSDDNGLFCLDPYNVSNIQFLSADLCGRLHRKCGTFQLQDRQEKPHNWSEIIYKASFGMLKKEADFGNRFDDMRAFAQEIGRSLDLDVEARENGWMLDSLLLDRLKYIMRRRKQFAVVLNYLALNCEEEAVPYLSHHSRQMLEAAQQWEIILQLLLKMFYTKSWETGRLKIADKLRELADFEEQIALAMIQISK